MQQLERPITEKYWNDSNIERDLNMIVMVYVKMLMHFFTIMETPLILLLGMQTK